MENKSFKVYSNDIAINVSVYDLSIQFRQQSLDGIETMGTVYLSPQHAKALLRVLKENVEQYEALFGEIYDLTPEKFKELQEKGIMKAEAGQQ